MTTETRTVFFEVAYDLISKIYTDLSVSTCPGEMDKEIQEISDIMCRLLNVDAKLRNGADIPDKIFNRNNSEVIMNNSELMMNKSDVGSDVASNYAARIEALQMENSQLQSDVFLARLDYKHIWGQWEESRKIIHRQTERYLSTYRELQAAKAEIERLKAKYESLLKYYEKEIPRLHTILHQFLNEITLWGNKNDVETTTFSLIPVLISERDNYTKQIKAEAIKEFAERLCEGRVSNDPVVIAVKVELESEGKDGEQE